MKLKAYLSPASPAVVVRPERGVKGPAILNMVEALELHRELGLAIQGLAMRQSGVSDPRDPK